MRRLFQQLSNWPKGIRFYIGLVSLVVTAEAYWWARSVYGDASTALIRLQEVYALIALGLILATLAIGPLCSLVSKLSGKAVLRDARRLLGVSAAWFAGLHIAISYVDQFEAANPLNLPGVYQRAFGIGLIAFIILLALTFTSFDGAFKRMGCWWFRLHRLIYAAVLLILGHAFMIGVHATSWVFIGSLTAAVALLFAAQFYLGFGPGRNPTVLRSFILCYGLLATIAVFTYGYTQHLNVSEVDESKNNGGQYGLR